MTVLTESYVDFYNGSDQSARYQFEQLSKLAESIAGTFSSLSGEYVLKAGDTMLGTLNTQNANPAITYTYSLGTDALRYNDLQSRKVHAFDDQSPLALNLSTVIGNTFLDVGVGIDATASITILNEPFGGLLFGSVGTAGPNSIASLTNGLNTAFGTFTIGNVSPVGDSCEAYIDNSGLASLLVGQATTINVPGHIAEIYHNLGSSGAFSHVFCARGLVSITGAGSTNGIAMSGGGATSSISVTGSAILTQLLMQGSTPSIAISGDVACVFMRAVSGGPSAVISGLASVTHINCAAGSPILSITGNGALTHGTVRDNTTLTNASNGGFIGGVFDMSVANAVTITSAAIAGYIRGHVRSDALAGAGMVVNGIVGRAEGRIGSKTANPITAGTASTHWCAWGYGDTTLGPITASAQEAIQFYAGVNAAPRSHQWGDGIRIHAERPVFPAVPVGAGNGSLWVDSLGNCCRISVGIPLQF